MRRNAASKAAARHESMAVEVMGNESSNGKRFEKAKSFFVPSIEPPCLNYAAIKIYRE